MIFAFSTDDLFLASIFLITGAVFVLYAAIETWRSKKNQVERAGQETP